MDCEFDQFDDVDDSVLSAMQLDFPLDVGLEENTSCPKSPRDTDSGIDTQDIASNIEDDSVEVPKEFPFPFKPYDIQVGFMKELYKVLELGKIGIFESPTGTGKSLSLICGALTWLRDFEEKQRQELEALLNGEDPSGCSKQPQEQQQNTEELDWISAFAKKQENNEKAKILKEEQEARLKREARLQELRNNLRPDPRAKRKHDKLEDDFDELFKDATEEVKEKLAADLENCENVGKGDDDDETIVVAEYESDGEGKKAEESDSDEDEDDDTHITKIYYCSRTHSQLAQFVREIQKSPFGEDTKVVSLGSRQNLCINEAVKKMQSLTLMNDRCLELQRNKSEPKKKSGEAPAKRKKTSGGCPFYKQDPILDFRDRALVEVRDIEQLVGVGREMKACPYYGTRYAIPAAQLVALPYNTLLHKSTRESCGIKLKGNIVIIDEAHNLIETISNVHSVEVTGAQVMCAHSQLSQYMERYKSRLKAKNLMYIKQILFILSSLIKCLGGKPGLSADKQQTRKSAPQLQTINDFLFGSQLDNLNLFKIKKYCEKSMISRKLHGFVEKYQPSMVIPVYEKKKDETGRSGLSKFLQEISQGTNETKVHKVQYNLRGSPVKESEEPEEPRQPTFTSPLMHIERFLESLTNTNKDGRIVINKQELLSRSSLKFLLLNPAVHFGDILSEARAVIVAGGTMQPICEFKDQLFFNAGAQADRILHYGCGHVIGADQILPIALGRGSSGLELDFTYQSRDLPEMMDELGRVVYNLCNIVPGGIVCFFPSYEYEKCVYNHWEKEGFLEKMCAKKKVLREPKRASQVDQILKEYSSYIKKSLSNSHVYANGALLLCVVGGKMSEGINFSDELGRCIVMVGLPYPNIRSPELKEKMDYLNANMPRAPDGRTAGQLHYENLCMKAVNQSIGRAIRHKNDYATILLLDHRYLRPTMKSKLPGWISRHLRPIDRFGPGFAAVRKFFAEKKTSLLFAEKFNLAQPK